MPSEILGQGSGPGYAPGMEGDPLSAAEERLIGAQLVADLLEARILQGGLSDGAHAVLYRAWQRADRMLGHYRDQAAAARGGPWSSGC